MKKRVVMYALTVAVILSTVGCGEESNKVTPSSGVANANKETPAPSSSPTATPTAKPNSTKEAKNEVFFGTWKTTKILRVSRTPGLTDKQMKSYIGQKVVYSRDLIKIGKYRIKNPEYGKMKWKTEDWFQDYSRQEIVDLFGEMKKHVVEIDFNGEIIGEDGTAFGWFFIVKDKNTLIVSYNSVEFELVRVK